MMELEVEEEGNCGGGRAVGLHLSLRFDPSNPPLDHALFSFPLSALLGILGWRKNSYGRQQESPVLAEDGGKSTVAIAVVAAAVAVCLSVMFVSDRQPRWPRRRRSASRALSLPGSCDGLRVLSNDESPGRVIHGVSVAAAPVLAASTEAETTATGMAGANAGEETEEVQLQKDEEAERLREMWMSLLEREQKLELRMLELCGLKEQEAIVRELENRVNVAAVEARLLELKVESLQQENQRLKAQVSELEDVKAKLERAKEKLKAMKRREEAEQEARHVSASLVEKMEEVERDRAERVTEMVAEVAALRKMNAGLEEENSELALRLQDAEQIASSVNLALEEDILEEANFLREANKRLSVQIEQLRSDHCAHVEELVYLKWVNACLRHELRSHDGDHHDSSSGQREQQQDGSHALSAMDLSKSMSYRSSEKAKQLMLEHGHIAVDIFDHSLFSPMHDSHDGEPERSPDAPTTAAAATPARRAGQSKLKFLGNIKKLLRGHGHGHGNRKSKKLPDDEQLSKAMRWLASHDVLDGGNSSYESTPTSSCNRTPASSVTTVESRERGDRGQSSAAMPGTRKLVSETARSKSDVGASHRREAGRYHALRPDHPAELGELHFRDFGSSVNYKAKDMQSNV